MADTAVVEPRGGEYAGVHAGFVAWLARRRLSGRTRGNYAERADKYLRWLTSYDPQADPITTVEGRDWAVRDYRSWLLTVAKATPATVATTLTALQAFYDHLGVVGRLDVDRPAPAKRAPKALDAASKRRLLRAGEACGSVRDRAVLLVLYATGIRVGELAALDVDDVPLTARTGVVIVRAGKGSDGGVYREVPLAADARGAVKAWLDDRAHWPGCGSMAALFPNRRGGRLTTRALRGIIDRLAAAAGVEASPHTLRHTAATRWLRAGVDIVTVAELLGHAWLDTTRRYTQPSTDQLHAAVEAGHIDY